MDQDAGHGASWRLTLCRKAGLPVHPTNFEPEDSRLEKSQIVAAGAEDMSSGQIVGAQGRPIMELGELPALANSIH